MRSQARHLKDDNPAKICYNLLKLMKAFFSICLTFFLLLSIACSSPHDEYAANTSSLKFQTEKIEEGIKWADYVETIKLANIYGSKGLEDSVKATAQNLTASNIYKEYDYVLPYIEGFAPLDTSKLPEKCRKLASDFCDGIKIGSIDSSLMKPSREFLATLFMYNYAAVSDPKDEISFYIFGTPFIGSAFIQLPVRLYYSEDNKDYRTHSHFDFFLYFEEQKGEYKISDIDFRQKEIKKEDSEDGRK